MPKPSVGYRLAVEQGYAEAQYFLGYMYHEGHGVPQDYKEAAKWYRLAAEQRNAIAEVSLGGMYENGQGVPQDYIQAYRWFNLASASSIAENAKDGTNGRDRVAGSMTADQIAEAQRLGQIQAVGSPGTFELHVTSVRSLEHDRRVGFSKALEVYAVSAYGPQMSYILNCTKVAPQAGQFYAALDEYLDSSWLRLWPVDRSTLSSGAKKKGRVFRVITIQNMLPGPKPDVACDIYSETARQ